MRVSFFPTSGAFGATCADKWTSAVSPGRSTEYSVTNFPANIFGGKEGANRMEEGIMERHIVTIILWWGGGERGEPLAAKDGPWYVMWIKE